MLSSTSFIAPFAKDNSVKNCEKVEVPGFGTIVTVIDEKSLSVTNFTTPDHILSAGKVTRQIVKQGNKIIVFTFGKGNNRNEFLAWINQLQTSADILWHNVDIKLKAEVENRLNNKNTSKPWDTYTSPDKAFQFSYFKDWEFSENSGGSKVAIIKKNKSDKNLFDALVGVYIKPMANTDNVNQFQI